MPFWRDLGRALRDTFESFIHPERPLPSPPEEEIEEEEKYEPGFGGYEEEPEEYSQGPFGGGGGDEYEEQYPDKFIYDPDNWDQFESQYPYNWGENQVEYWDRVMDGRPFEDQDQYTHLQDLFEQAFMDQDLMSRDLQAEFMDEAGFYYWDWDAHQAYWDEESPAA